MKIGYPCINTGLDVNANKTFRLKSYNPEKFISTVKSNLAALKNVLEYNVRKNLLFFRISSDIIPFASHDILTVDWQTIFSQELIEIGAYIKENNMRISMHPAQFVVINSPNSQIVQNSERELLYHAQFLESLKLDNTHKIQIHVGGAYSDKSASINRFISNYSNLDSKIKNKLVIENDERLYSLDDCLEIHKQIKVPVIFDTLHYECNNNGESITIALTKAVDTWRTTDGIAMVDYSSQARDCRVGKHCQTMDEKHFKEFLQNTLNFDFDIMIEVKDKQISALKAIEIAAEIRKIDQTHD